MIRRWLGAADVGNPTLVEGPARFEFAVIVLLLPFGEIRVEGFAVAYC